MFSKTSALLLAASLLASPIAASAIPTHSQPSSDSLQSRGEGSGATLETFRSALHRRTSEHIVRRAADASTTTTTADAFPCENWAKNVACAQFDVLVVGGGPSGLQTALSLGRLGRSVMIVDSQTYRNHATLEAHDVIVLDGMTPAHIRELARGNLSAYPSIHYSVGSIKAIKSVDNATYFESQSSIGTFTSRKVVLATGVLDKLPAIDGIQEIWGSGGFWCPWCDGWEHRGGPLGVLDMSNAGEALALTKLNPDTTVYTNGLAIDAVPVTSPSNITTLLAAASIPVETSKILKLGLKDPADRRSAVVMKLQNKTTELKGFMFTTVRNLQSPNLIEDLSLNITNTGGNAIGRIDYTGQTSAFGVWAVGDAASTSKNLANAIYSGKSAAVPIVFRLGYEESYARAGFSWRY